MTIERVLQFWFEDLEPEQWWAKDEALDQRISDEFCSLHTSAQACELFEWRGSAEGRLAEVIVLDQFSRNIYRDTPKSFAQDPLALALGQEAIALGEDQKLDSTQRGFLYLPFMHSESTVIHQQAVRLYAQPGMEYNLDFEHKHKNIIDRFGRYPHRNAILGRESSAEELVFLQQPGSSF